MTRRIAFLLSLLAGIFLLLFLGALTVQALPNFEREHWKILTVDHWSFHERTFGALSMLYGTLVVSFIAIVIAFPLGLGAAIFVSEFLTGKARAFAKVSIELLAGIPSVVYGLLGVLYLREWIFPVISKWGAVSGDCLLTGGILLAVMILPTMMTLADDALRCVPRRTREATWGLGLSKRQAILAIVLPQAWPGIFGAAILAFGRAFGETIAVYLVVGRADQSLPESLFSLKAWIEAGQTMTTKLGGSESAIAYGDAGHWSALMALGFILWLMVGILGYLSQCFMSRGYTTIQ